MVRNFLAGKPSIQVCKIALIDDQRGTLLCRASEDDTQGLVIWVMPQQEADRIEHIREYMDRAVGMVEKEGYLTFARHTRELLELTNRKS